MDKQFIKNILELRAEGKLKHNDITVIVAISTKLNFKEYKALLNRTIVNLTEMDKSNVSKSIKRLKDLKVLLSNEDGELMLNANCTNECQEEIINE